MRQTLHKYGFRMLLMWVFIFVVIDPFLSALPHAAKFISQALFSMVLFFAIYAVNKEKKLLTISITLLALTLMSLWLRAIGVTYISWTATLGIIALYLGVVIYSFFSAIFSARKVTAELLNGTLCLYLFIGLFWGSIYALLEQLLPGSFAGTLLKDPLPTQASLHAFNYFSFITLSTLGYGDIVPQTQQAAGLCAVEAILGQFFLAVMVASIVALKVSEKREKDRS